MLKAKRQMPKQTGRVGEVRGEAAGQAISDEACDPLSEHPDIGFGPNPLLTGLLDTVLLFDRLRFTSPI